MNTSAELEALWFGRDSRYAQRKTRGEISLSDPEMESIRGWRRSEADALPGLERAKALTRLAVWVPPRGR